MGRERRPHSQFQFSDACFTFLSAPRDRQGKRVLEGPRPAQRAGEPSLLHVETQNRPSSRLAPSTRRRGLPSGRPSRTRTPCDVGRAPGCLSRSRRVAPRQGSRKPPTKKPCRKSPLRGQRRNLRAKVPTLRRVSPRKRILLLRPVRLSPLARQDPPRT